MAFEFKYFEKDAIILQDDSTDLQLRFIESGFKHLRVTGKGQAHC